MDVRKHLKPISANSLILPYSDHKNQRLHGLDSIFLEDFFGDFARHAVCATGQNVTMLGPFPPLFQPPST